MNGDPFNPGRIGGGCGIICDVMCDVICDVISENPLVKFDVWKRLPDEAEDDMILPTPPPPPSPPPPPTSPYPPCPDDVIMTSFVVDPKPRPTNEPSVPNEDDDTVDDVEGLIPP